MVFVRETKRLAKNDFVLPQECSRTGCGTIALAVNKISKDPIRRPFSIFRANAIFHPTLSKVWNIGYICGSIVLYISINAIKWSL